MKSGRDNDFKNDNISKSDILSWIFSKTFSLIKYPIAHPYDSIVFLLCLNAIRVILKLLQEKNDTPVKYPIDKIQMAYTGPSVRYVPDEKFDLILDIEGWVSDRHPTGYYDFNEDPSYRHVTTSFNTEKFSKKDREGLFEAHRRFYQLCYHKSDVDGYANLLSHRSVQSPAIQSTFGFYGQPKIEKLFYKDYQPNIGFIIGIRAFGNRGYYSSVNNNKTTYQLAKINLDSIDFDKLKCMGQHNSMSGIAHIYIKDNVLAQHPDTEYLESTFCKDGWTDVCFENYIKNLPNFSSVVDWVIQASDYAKVIKDEPVINLINNEEINILKWQKKEQKKSHAPMEKHGIFAFPRPSDYSNSFEYDMSSGQRRIKPPLLFKIGNK